MRLDRITFPVIIAIAAIAGTAPAAEPSAEQLQAQLIEAQRRIDQQDQKLAELQAALGQNWLSEARAAQVKALVREVLADADTRAALLDQPITAGWDKGFFLASGDGNFLLRIRGMIQARYVANFRDDSGDDNSRNGFELTRVRFGFMGHVVDPTWQYMIWTGHHYNKSSGGGNDLLLDAWIKKDLGDGWSVTAGQFKLPFWQEWLISETKQQFVERSLVHAKFSGSYTQGIKVDYAGDVFRGTASFNDGTGNLNCGWSVEDTEYAFTGRGEVLLAGDWSEYSDFESWRGEQFMAVIGAAAHYQEGEYGTPSANANFVQWTVDASLEFGGANLFAAVVGDHIHNGASYDKYGFVIQGGYFATEKLELIARYEWGDDDTGGDDRLSVLTLGANYFFAKHQLRLTADVSYAFEPVGSAWASDFYGYLPDATGQEGQVVVRAQMQLVF